VKKPGEYLYLTMSEDPLGRGSYTLHEGRPPRERTRGEIDFRISRRGAGVWCSILTGSCGACKVKARIVGGIYE
jgi:hypothetical protein